MKARSCYLSLGANLGARGETLREALRRIAAVRGIALRRVSSFYETAPWGRLDQPAFLNAAAQIETVLEPCALLAACQRIERELGRVRREHWGARTIDIDMLCMEGVALDTERLRLPHPYMMERAFVLVPLAEIAPALIVGGVPVRVALARTAGQAAVRAQELSAPWPLRLIACMDEARGIGRAGGLLVRLPEDMAHFRQLTMGGVVVMGRRTMETLPQGKPLAGRLNVVLSRTLAKGAGGTDGFLVCAGLHDLWRQLGAWHGEETPRTLWCIGGAAVYAALLPYAAEAYLTEVPGTHGADVFLPKMAGFSLVSRVMGKRCAFARYVRETAKDWLEEESEHGNLS